jgi:hypothetical protein
MHPRPTIDEHLLQLVAVHRRSPCRGVAALQAHALGGAQVLHQQQAIVQRLCGADRLQVAGELAGARELQHLRDDEALAFDLLVGQPQLAAHALRCGAQQLADDIEVALYHRDRVLTP